MGVDSHDALGPTERMRTFTRVDLDSLPSQVRQEPMEFKLPRDEGEISEE